MSVEYFPWAIKSITIPLPLCCMDFLLSFVLELYRLAQEAPVTEFPDLALQMLKAVVRFRTATWSDDNEPFSEADRALVNALMPHLAKAITINQSLAAGEWATTEQSRRCGTRALVECKDGAFLYCATPFLELLRREWSDWSEPGIPLSLLSGLRGSQRVRVAGGTVEISAQTLGDAWLLTASSVSPLERLSPRERAVAREFGAGKPYKAIAKETRLAPSTVRNVLQHAYKKLGVGNKVALARLFEDERTSKSRF